MLTEKEHEAMTLTAQLTQLMAEEIIKSGPTAKNDTAELAFHIHGIQRMILSQAAGRYYPDLYRLLGEGN